MSDERPAKELEKIVVRLPDGMRDRLAEAARANKRSTNAEVVARLEASFERAALPGLTSEQIVGLLYETIREEMKVGGPPPRGS